MSIQDIERNRDDYKVTHAAAIEVALDLIQWEMELEAPDPQIMASLNAPDPIHTTAWQPHTMRYPMKGEDK